MHFDIVVLGGGTAGCVLAGRLSELTDLSICLVEAGPDYGPYAAGRWPEDILDARWLAFSHAWETEHEDRSQLRARILGGCSAHNACVLLEGEPADYDEWGHGWSYDTLEPYLARARNRLRRRQLEYTELTPWHRAFVEAADAPDVILHPVNAVGTVRWNAAFAYLDPVRSRTNLTILADTLVDRVQLDGSRVTGAATSTGEISAEKIVLTAGAYGSPAILLRSGIGPARGLPVGDGLCDHVGVGFGFEPSDALREDVRHFADERPLAMGQVTIAARSRYCPTELRDLFVFPGLEPLDDGGYEISAGAFVMKTTSRGSVRLNSDDPRVPLAIDHGFLNDPTDAEMLEDAIAAVREFAASAPVRRYATHEVRPGADLDAATLVRTSARGFFHPTGTCAIGRVVDGDGRVIGFDNLYVADASIIPSIPRVNPNLTVAAVAEKLAVSLAAT